MRTPISKPAIVLRDMALRALKQMYEARGISNPNVGKDSDSFVRFDAISEVLGLALANSDSIANDIFAETASDEALLEHAKSLGISGLREAEYASGDIRLSLRVINGSTTPITIDEGEQLVSEEGVLYEVTTTAIYDSGDYVPVVALESGTGGNLEYNSKLTWVDPEPTMGYAWVGPLGLTGGRDLETIEELRDRVRERRRIASVAGSPAHLIQVSEEVSSTIQKAFAYPAIFGPGSGMIALMGYFTDETSYSRLITDRVVAAVGEAIEEVIPGEVKITVKSVVEEDCNLAIKLDLPEPIYAGGSGSGWLDSASIRFPVPTSNSSYCAISAFSNASRFTCVCEVDNNPIVGNRIAIYSPTEKKFYHATILNVLSTDGTTHEIVIDIAMPDIAVGMYVSPDCENLDAYNDEILLAFQKMGPGEATADSTRLPRARRRPEIGLSYTPKIGNRLFKDLLNNYSEIGDVEVYYASLTTPTIPTIGNAPNILVPNHINIFPG